MKIKLKSGLYLPSSKQEPAIETVINFLTRSYISYDKQLVTNYYWDALPDGSYVIPRFFPLEKYLKNIQIEDERHCGKDIEIQHNIVPRSKTQAEAIKRMINSKSGLFVLATGSGKTVISVCAAAEIKKKTLILVHKLSLVEQWIESFKKFTTLKDEDISQITSENFEEDLLQKSVCITTVQTLCSLKKRKYKEVTKALEEAQIGLFIADEVHTSVGAPLFSAANLMICAPRVFGLSATPNRVQDSDIIRFHLGEDQVFDASADIMDAKVLCIGLSMGVLKNRYKYIYWGREFQRARYLNMLRNSESLKYVVSVLLKKVVKEERQCIVITERLKIIEEWSKNLVDQEGIVGVFTGSNGRREELKKQIVFSTPGKMRDGVDVVEKDTLIMTSPISNITQMVGRILRTNEGKKQPLVIDLIDLDCPEIKNSFISRKNFYESKNWEITYLRMKENSQIEILNNHLQLGFKH